MIFESVSSLISMFASFFLPFIYLYFLDLFHPVGVCGTCRLVIQLCVNNT